LNSVAITCPLCANDSSTPWAQENGFTVHRCQGCGLLYVNPRPSNDEISEANKVGVHRGDELLDVRTRRDNSKIAFYRAIIRDMFAEEFSTQSKVDWLDVGAGYGEVVAAVLSLAPTGSNFCGIEPMKPKVAGAQKLGLPVTSRSLDEVTDQFDVISLINVYSHIPDFLGFAAKLIEKLRPGGVLFVETGNLADLESRDAFPDKLCLPDHLVFAGSDQMRLTFEKLGLSLERQDSKAIDSPLWCLKIAIKNAMRGRLVIPLPGQSPSRKVFYKARLP
jgi:SAM-dependent methyltransferase